MEGDLVRPTFERLVGGSGNDVLAAHTTRQFGNSTVSDGTTLVGRAGNDVLRGTRFTDVLDGNDGDDRLRGGGRRDYLLGHQGEDELYAGKGSDQLRGGDNDDLLFARDGRRDTVNGGDGLDIADVDPADRLRRVEAVFL
jgi:serralysin